MSNLDLGVVGNCILGALIDRQARVVWCCFPRFDGDPVFCSLIDGNPATSGDHLNQGRGYFEITVDGLVSSEQRYARHTAILETDLTDDTGATARVTDFAPRFKQHGRIFRPTMLVRRIAPIRGNPRIRVRLRPRFNYGATKPTKSHGSNHIRFQSVDLALRLTTDAPISYIEEEAAFVLDRPYNFLLGPDETIAASIPETAREFQERTEEYWLDWVRYLSVPFEWQEMVIRAAITLKLCSYEETGAIIAAMTTSIPEAPNTERGWDYRYCWLRDAYFVVHTLNRLGATRTMEDFLTYIRNVVALDPGGRLKPVYAILPAASFDERIVDNLSGFRGMGPVRVGNLARDQVQNDSYGSVVLALTQMFFDQRLPQMGDVDLFCRLEKLGDQAAMMALEPDAGIWEFRGRQRIHTYSSAMCWAACDRLAMIAAALGLEDRVEYWRSAAEDIRNTVLKRAWNPKLNSFVESFGGSELDASLLQLHEIGFISATDPRFLGTVAAIERSLLRSKHLFRYAAPDDFGLPETAFTSCTFWYIDALAAVGRRDEARLIFEHVLASRNHLGLLSEDIDPSTGELWGNFPQTYSMVGLIVCAMRLSKTWEEAFWRGS